MRVYASARAADYCRARLAAHKRPKVYVTVGSLPTTPLTMGEVDRWFVRSVTPAGSPRRGPMADT